MCVCVLVADSTQGIESTTAIASRMELGYKMRDKFPRLL